MKYLVTLEVGKADVFVQDADGYTSLHNACSKGRVICIIAGCWPLMLESGYLDVVRWLCESGGAAGTYQKDGKSGRGVDIRSMGGWTPLST